MRRVLEEQHALSGLFIAHLLSRNMRIEEDWWTNFSTPARNGWHGLFCCSSTMATKATRKSSSEVSQQILAG